MEDETKRAETTQALKLVLYVGLGDTVDQAAAKVGVSVERATELLRGEFSPSRPS